MSTQIPDLVPARMLNEFVYCPRLGYMMWADAEFADSADTMDGRRVHGRTDRETGALPDPEEEAPSIHARSVWLSAPSEGLTARMDLVEGEGRDVTPVDYKRGKRPDISGGVWEPERVQICAQALVLRENGYRCDSGVVYFCGSRTRVEVPITDELLETTRHALSEFRSALALPRPPQPLVDSPKCPRCALVGICLPDEVSLLTDAAAGPDDVRRLYPARDDALPLYVQTQGARVGKKGDRLEVRTPSGEKHEIRILEVSQLSLFGNIQVTTQALRELCNRGIPVCYFSTGGWFYGIAHGLGHKNIQLRILQFAGAADEARSLGLAKRFVTAKIRNQRTMLRRNAEGIPAPVLRRLSRLVKRAESCDNAEELLGVEGSAARDYWAHFPRMLKGDLQGAFEMDGRNRRPPRDPTNALLSFGYSLLTRELTVTAMAVGFDPLVGFYHKPRYGRPALALDLMEEFRPLVVDSAVLQAVNTGVVGPNDFVRRGGAVALQGPARSRFIKAYERRMDQLVSHPLFGYRVSYRRILEVQARLLARHLNGELSEYPQFCTR